MCGIAGIYNVGQDAEEIVSRMISILRHRGPDETGMYLDDQIAMGQTRLSIVGLGDGTQPISNEDGTLWVVYNGEVFNYPELKADLEGKGHVFRTGTDTEILVHIYEEYGPSCLERLNGQFAFAIWDNLKKELFLARDRVGIRPLHYCNVGEKFLFASEIKAIFLDPAVHRELDIQSLSQIFTLWTTLTPRTIFKDIFELPPGHFMLVRRGEIVKQEPFWSVPYFPPENSWIGSFDEAIEAARELLLDAIRIRLRADVPVGAYLSGGLDSSIITALISGNFNNNLRTFSIGFKDEKFDESPFQKMMVEHLGTDHSHLEIDNEDIRANFPAVVRHCEKPLLRTAPVPMFLLSRLVRQNNYKVVLTGEGADEVFAGYNIFKEAKVRNFWSKNPASHLRPLLLERLYPYIFKDPSRGRAFLQKFFSVSEAGASDPLFSHQVRWNNTGGNRLFFSDGVKVVLDGYRPEEDVVKSLPDCFIDRDILSRAQYLEMSIFLSNYLLSSQGDRVAMGNSLELRVPFLDFRMIEFAMKLPSSWKLHVMNEKYILKKVFSDLLPEEILSRPKHPYRAPIRDVFFGTADGYAKEYLAEENIKKSGYFDHMKTGRLVKRFLKDEGFVESETQNMALTGILSTQILHEQYIEKFDHRCVEPHSVDKKVDKRSAVNC
jgi:asparagine synthase (glutamine-hydrolysing)